MHRDTVRKTLENSASPGYRRQSPPPDLVLDPCRGVIDRTLERKDRSARPGRSFGRVGVAGGVRSAAQTAGVEDGQARQAGVRAGAGVDGELAEGGGIRGCTRRPQARRRRLRRRQAPGAMQHGGSSLETRLELYSHLPMVTVTKTLASAGSTAKLAGQCVAEGVDHPEYLLRLSELELIDRHHCMVDRAGSRRLASLRSRASTPSTSWPSRR